MERRWHRAINVALALAVVMAIFLLPQPALAASQTWYLTDIASGTNYIMNKGSSGGGGTPIVIPSKAGAYEIWQANEAASVTLGFQAGTWTGDLHQAGGDYVSPVQVDIGVWDGSGFTSYGYDSGYVSTTEPTWSFAISASDFNVPVGQHLAFKVLNNSSQPNRDLEVATDGTSFVTSPDTDPGYPVPELPTIILLGAGLACLGGYVAFKWHKKRGWRKAINVGLMLALVAAILVHALFQAALPVAASPAGLTFHSGFETGDFTEWNSVIGVNGQCSVQSTITETGDYAMRCNTSSGFAMTYEGGSPYRLTVYLYIAEAPDTDVAILGADGGVSVGLSSDPKLILYGGSPTETGNTVLDTSTWYRISLSLDAANDTAKVYLDGVEECSSTTVSGDVLENWLGPQDYCTTDLYFDNYASDDVESADDIGDIRVVRSSPDADGTNTDFDTREPTDGRPYYGLVDECPASDSDYVAQVATADAEETYGLQGRASLGIGVSATIHAVSTWCQMKRGGGGPTTHQMVEYDGGNYETTKDLTTDFVWYNIYRATPPSGGSWDWTKFDAYEAGAGNDNGGQDTYLSCVMVMVAVEPAPTQSQTWYLSSIGGSKVMYKGDDTKPAGTVTVADNEFQIWRADEAATVDVGFPANTWTGHITFDGTSLDTTVRVYVGSWDGSVFTAATGQADVTGSSDFSFSAGAFDVPKDEWLAFKIEDYDAGVDTDTVVVSVGGSNSYLTSGASDPGYPIPELPTIILLGAGLACLGGYVAFIRRKRRSVSL